MVNNTVKIAFDNLVIDNLPKGILEKDQYFYDEYDNRYVPINGAHLTYTLNTLTHKGIQLRSAVFTRGDHFCPLHVILREHKINYEFVLKDEIIKTNKKFLYYISPRFLVRHHISYPQINYLKDLFTLEHIQAINNGRCLLIINDIFECSYYTKQVINSFKEMCKEINLDTSKIVFFTNNIFNKENNCIYWQYFETATKIAYCHNLFKSYKSDKKLPFFRFLLLNCRTRKHRFYICYKLWKKDPDFFKHVSFSLSKQTVAQLINCDSYTVRDAQQTDFNYFIERYRAELLDIENFIKLLPSYTVFDSEFIKKEMYKIYYGNEHREQICSNLHEQDIFYKLNHWKHLSEETFSKTGIHIVTETLADFKNTEKMQYMFVTEKTFKPILFKKPFIIVGQKGILQHLRDCGYKTFNSLWDESYDTINDSQERYDKIIEVILKLSSMSANDFYDVINAASDIADYNYQNLMARTPEHEAVEFIKKFFK